MQAKQHLGLVLAEAGIEWCTARWQNDQCEIVDRGSKARELQEEVDTSEQFVALPAKGIVHACMPMSDILVRVVSLPTTSRDELADMVELQVGKMSPFPIDDLVVSFEVLESDETSSRVLIAAILRQKLDFFHEMGVYPQSVDIDLLAYWHGLRLEGEATRPGRVFYLFVNADSTQLIVAEEGVPVLFRTLMEREDLSETDYLEAVAEELSYAAIALEADCGASEGARAVVIAPGQEFSRIGDMLPEGMREDFSSFDLDALPPLSELVVRRRLEVGADCVDLTPAEWKSAARDRVIKKRMLFAAAGFIALWVLFVAGFMGYGHWQQTATRRLEKLAEELQEPALESQRLQMRIRALEQYADRTHSVLECLREVSVLLPRNLELLSFNFKKGDEINLRGVSSSPGAAEIYEYFQSLEDSDKFLELANQQVSTVTRRNVGRVSQFQVNLILPSTEEEP